MEIYTLPTTLTPHFFYLCYSLKLTVRGEWLEYISEGWRDFLQRIDQKPKAVWSCTFSGHRNGPLEWFSVEDQLKSRKLSGVNVFSGYISKGWSGFSQGIDPKPKAVWRERFFGVNLRRLVGLFAGYRPKAESCLELYFFGLSQRAAGEIFRKGLTKSRRQFGAVLFRVIAAGRLGSLAVGVERQPEVVWPERLFRVHFRTLARLFAGDRPKAGGSPKLLFFELSQQATWGASQSVGRRRPEVV